jgi:hypothetical protein
VAGLCDPQTGFCSDPAAADGTACADGDACTQSDTCQSGVCVGTNPVVCTASDQCHVAGLCDPQTGFCSDPAKPDGSACNDGNLCTQLDTCQTGACSGGNPVICVASDQCHLPGSCDTGTGFCSNPVAADGTACNDGNQCSVSDACTAGVCNGTPAPPPSAINDSVRLDKTPTDTTITWTDPPAFYNVYRGSNGTGPWAYNQTCLSTSLSGPSAQDTDVPLPDQLFYYVVSRVDTCNESTLGTDSSGTDRPNPNACAP